MLSTLNKKVSRVLFLNFYLCFCSFRSFPQEGSGTLKMPLPEYLQSTTGIGSLDDPVAPMPGVVERVLISEGATVEQGEPLVVMIAMKMEVRRIITICLAVCLPSFCSFLLYRYISLCIFSFIL